EKSFSVSPDRGERAKTATHASPRAANRRAPSARGSSAASSEHAAGWLPTKWCVSTVIARITPAMPSRMIHQSWPGPRRRSLCQPGRQFGQPAGEVRDVTAASARAGPRGCKGEFERGNPPPRAEEVTLTEALQSSRRRRVVARHKVDGALGEAAPQALAVLPLANRRGALAGRCAVRDVLRGEREVGGAGLDGDWEAGAPAVAQPVQGVGCRKMPDRDAT